MAESVPPARGPDSRPPAATPLPSKPPPRPRTAPGVRLKRRAKKGARWVTWTVLAVVFVVGVWLPWWVRRVEDYALVALGDVFRARFEVADVRVRFFPLAIDLTDFRMYLEDRTIMVASTIGLGLVRGEAGFELQTLSIHDSEMIFSRSTEGDYHFDEVLRAETFTGPGAARRVPVIEIYGSRVTYEDTRLARSVVLEDVSGVFRPRAGDARASYFLRVSGNPPGGGRVQLDGDFVLRPDPAGTFHWRVSELSTRELASLFGPLAPRFRGKVDGEGRLEGLMRRPDLDGTLRSDAVEFAVTRDAGSRRLVAGGLDVGLESRDGNIVLRPSLERLAYRDPLLPPEGVILADVAGTFELDRAGVSWSGVVARPAAGGTWYAREGHWRGDSVYLHSEVRGLPVGEGLRLAGVPRLQGRGEVAGELVLQGGPDAPAWTARFASDAGTLGGPGREPWVYRELEAVLEGTGSRVESLDLGKVQLDDATIEVRGDLDPRGEGNALSVSIERLGLGPLGAVLDAGLEGTATLVGDLSGSLAAPRLKGRVEVQDAVFRKGARVFDVDDLKARFDGVGTSEGFRGEVWELDAKLLEGAVVRGAGDLRPGGGGMDLSIQGLEAKRLFQALALPGVSAAGKVDLAGKIEASTSGLPAARVDVVAPALRLYVAETNTTLDFEDFSGEVHVRPRGGEYRMDLTGVKGRTLGGAVAVDGSVRLLPTLYYDVRCHLEGGDAAELSRRVIKLEEFELAGPASGDVTIRGDAGRSVVEGHGSLGDSTIRVGFGGKHYTLYPQALEGRIRLSPEEVRLGPLEGELDGGRLEAVYRVDPRDPDLPWRLSAKVDGVDARGFVGHYLTQRHDVEGTLAGNLFLSGKGTDRDYLAGAGELTYAGTIHQLEALEHAERKFSLRDLAEIEIHELKARLVALAGRLHAKKVTVDSSHGKARGDIFLHVRRGELDGGFKVALDRRCLSSGHRLASMLEGGRYFNFDLEVGGTLLDPKYTFSSGRMLGGAAMTGALMFTPAAVPLAIITGLRNLFRRRPRRPRPRAEPPPEDG